MNYLIWFSLAIFAGFLFVAYFKRYKMIKGMINQKESNKVINLTDQSFESVVGNGITLVDFWAPWCTPCKIQGPIISDVAEEIGEKAKITKLNIDENRKIAGKYGIRSIPTIYIFKNGEPVVKFVGVKTKTILLKAINEI